MDEIISRRGIGCEPADAEPVRCISCGTVTYIVRQVGFMSGDNKMQVNYNGNCINVQCRNFLQLEVILDQG